MGEVALTHRTEYRYDRPVLLREQIVRLKPARHARTPVTQYALTVEPAPARLAWVEDAHANPVAQVELPGRTDRFAITVDLVAAIAHAAPVAPEPDDSARTYPFAYDAAEAGALATLREPQPAGPLLARRLAAIDALPRDTVALLESVNGGVRRDVRYVERPEPGVLTPEQTLARGQGACRDSAWLLVETLRHLGFAARFVSGYLIELGAKDRGSLHAWCEVALPGAGWVGLDPTSGLFTGACHLPLAAAAEPSAAAPVSGLLEPCQSAMTHAIVVRRV